MKLAGIWGNGPNTLYLRDKQVDTLDDLKGIRIRAPSRLAHKMLAALGATPVGMPVTLQILFPGISVALLRWLA